MSAGDWMWIRPHLLWCFPFGFTNRHGPRVGHHEWRNAPASAHNYSPSSTLTCRCLHCTKLLLEQKIRSHTAERSALCAHNQSQKNIVAALTQLLFRLLIVWPTCPGGPPLGNHTQCIAVTVPHQGAYCSKRTLEVLVSAQLAMACSQSKESATGHWV
jgi:hypothetical protein